MIVEHILCCVFREQLQTRCNGRPYICIMKTIKVMDYA